MKYRSEMNLTSGNLFMKVIKFVLPLMLTSVFQLLYTSIDLWTVSKFGGGSNSMSAIGVNNPLINLIVTFLISLSTGSNVAISIAKGKNDKEKADKILHTSFLLALICGFIVGIFGFFVSPYLLTLMDTPSFLYEKACQYLKIYFLGAPLVLLYNFGAQMLRALGDSKRPMFFLMISGIINVIFDFIFVYFMHLDVIGVAIATVISQLVSASLVILWFIFYKHCFVNLDLKRLKIHLPELKEILKIGIPGGLQGLAFCIPNVMIQSSLYSITNHIIDGAFISQAEVIAGSSASSQIEGYIFVMIDSFAVAILSFVGQNFGAKNINNIKKSYWYSVFWMCVVSAVSFLICLLFPNQLLSIFIKQGDGEKIIIENAIAAGKERLMLLSATYFLDGWMSINSSYLRGMKKTIAPAIITILGCTGTRILFLLTLFPYDYFHTLFWLYSVFPISWILVNITYIPTILTLQKKQLAQIAN